MNIKPEDLAANRRRALEAQLLEALEKDPWNQHRDVRTLARVVASKLSDYEERLDALAARLPERFVAHQPPGQCSQCGSVLFESYRYCDKKNCTDHPPHEISVLNFVCHCGAIHQVAARTTG